MLNLFVTGPTAFFITLLAIPAIIRVADEKKLFDLPDARKLHTRPIASLGGVGIFIGFSVAIFLTGVFQKSPELQYIMAAALAIFFLGLKDDILILSATKKFIGQLAAAAILVHLAGIRIDSMHGIFGIGTLPVPLSILFSYATIIVIINAFNLIDGVDGLAGSLGMISTGLFGTYFFMAGHEAYAMLAFAMMASLLAFLLFNFHPARIFMGDSGSLLLGLMNAILVIKFINVATASQAAWPIPTAVALGFVILLVPLLDTLRVFAIRIYHGRSPFSPDRNHIHHLLLDRGFCHIKVTLSCVSINLAFVGLVYWGSAFGSTLLLAGTVTLSFALIGALYYLRKPVRGLVVASSFKHTADVEIPSATKLVSISKEAAVVER
jgi:UDP-N-acetylmuramyl pentapeptide phosphotransferase/UDP-N-acetylglucosamine-1-phosphate transferase